ncbi:MAG: secondary thiamine-phosphate synthase enzyme YjbQ [Spirochaetes bacterium]|nr:secondary thiamine-phosphate synthase enzyme YjbQ [Spirochaetota bacterium]
MAVYQKSIHFHSKAFDAVYDITERVTTIVRDSGIENGLVNVFHIGSTAAITTIEYEPGLKEDFPAFLNRIIPRGENYQHNNTWGDGNGDGHIKASLIGPQITCPVKDGDIVLGTWQQIILIDSDNKPRNRNLIVTVSGD